MKSALSLLIFLMTFVCFAQDFKKLSSSKKCYVKKIEKGEFESVNPKKFQGWKLVSKPHSKNKKFSIFKYDGKIHVTPTSCLSEYGKIEEDEEEVDLQDYSEVNKAGNNWKISRASEYSEKEFFIHLTGGVVAIVDKKRIFEYDQLDSENCDEDNPAETCDFTDPSNSQYKTGASISGKFGWASTNGNFWLISLKTFKGKKLEQPSITVTNVGTGTADFIFKDRFTNFLFGKKYIFNENSQFRPTLSILGGLSTISSEVEVGEEKFKFRSSGLALNLETGIEYMLNSTFGLTVALGYEYLGQRTFRIVKENGDTINNGFKTKQDYSNGYFEAGLITYF
jgi:hypothetical protein